jgi:hypothetical protein
MSRDNQLMLMYGGGTLAVVLLLWAGSGLSSAEITPVVGAASGSLAVVLMCIAGAAAICLMVLSVLVPVFIYWIYSDVKKMREIAEKNQSRIEQMRLDFSLLRRHLEK